MDSIRFNETHSDLHSSLSVAHSYRFLHSVDFSEPFVDPDQRVSVSPPSLPPAVYTLSNWWNLLPTEFQEKAKQGQEKVAMDNAILEDPQVGCPKLSQIRSSDSCLTVFWCIRTFCPFRISMLSSGPSVLSMGCTRLSFNRSWI